MQAIQYILNANDATISELLDLFSVISEEDMASLGMEMKDGMKSMQEMRMGDEKDIMEMFDTIMRMAGK